MMRVIKLFFGTLGLLWAQADPLAEGLERFHRGDYLGAESYFVDALRAGEQETARTFLALTRASTGRCKEAEGELEALFATLNDSTLRRLAGIAAVGCRLARQDYEGALPLSLRLRQLYPSDADVLYQAARLHLRAWNDIVHQLFVHSPASYRVNQLSAEIFEIQGRFAEAVNEYRKAIQKNPAAIHLHYRLGRALLMSSHSPDVLREAKKSFEAELELNPNDAAAEFQIAQILLVEGETAESARRLERALKLEPDFPEALVALGKLRSREQRHGQAIELLERAVDLAPRSEPARYALMQAYQAAGRREEARRQQEELEKLRSAPSGEFTEFLKRLGESTSSEREP